MSGITNAAFRRFIRAENPGAVGLVVTEFVSVEGLTRNNKQSQRMICTAGEARPVSVQIFGYDIDRMVQSAQLVEESGADILDINSGCPVPKVVRRGGGCELMRQPEHLAKLLRALRAAVSLPLTLKIRAGWDETSRNAVEIAKIAEDAGVQMLAIHERTRTQLYRGEADWGIVADVARAVSIPVVGSGDVRSGESALRSLSSGVQALMIGRGALANPWVFTEVRAALEGRDYLAPHPAEIPGAIRRYLGFLREELPEKAVLGKLKQLAGQATRLVRGASAARKSLVQTQSVEQFLDVLADWEHYLSGIDRGQLADPESFGALEEEAA